MALDVDTIFANNWSYRLEEKRSLQLAGDSSFPIVECRQCKFVYAMKLPDREFFQKIYDRVIDEEAARQSNLGIGSMTYRMDYLATLLRLLPDNGKEKTILDFGCGFGPTLHLLKALPNIKALGYENSELRVSQLISSGVLVTNNLSVVGDGMPYDAIILDNVLEHLPDPREMLSLIRSWCGKDTILYVSVPDSNADFMARQRAAHETGCRVSMEINPWEHLNYFDVDHLDAFLKKVGFAPMAQSELPGVVVNIGLRPELSFLFRLKNGLASVMRLFEYVRRGNAISSPAMRYYRVNDL